MAARTLRDYTTTVLMVLMFVLFSVASFRTEAQQHTQDVIAAKQVVAVAQIAANQHLIAANSARLELMVKAECRDRAAGVNEQNRVLDALITASSSWGPQVQSARLALWRAAKSAPVIC